MKGDDRQSERGGGGVDSPDPEVDANAVTRIASDSPTEHPPEQASEETAVEGVDVNAATRVASTRERRAAQPPDSGDPHPGIVPGSILFGEYEIIEVLGAGGMGEVYRAQHRRLEEPRAIKMMHAELSGKKGANEFFLREAKALLAVRHPAVVHCHDLLSDEHGRVYLIMEMIEGVSLSEKMEHGPLRPDEVVELGARLAAGLTAAHSCGVVHRDVSPDNVVLPGGDVSEAKLIDFGIAKILQEGQGTIVDGFKGKLSYASPEQLGFFGGRIDGRSDFYSLGLVLCAAALGRSLGMGATMMEAVDARRHLHRVPDEIPVGLRSAIEPLLALDPADRPRMVERLFLAPGTAPTGVSTPRGQGATESFLSPARKWAAAALVLASGLALAGYLLTGDGLRQTELAARPAAPATGLRPEAPIARSAAQPSEQASPTARGERVSSTDTNAGQSDSKSAPVAQPRPQPTRRTVSALEKVRIVGLLRGAEVALTENRLQSPRGDNAYEKYTAVLELDPENRAAKSGLEDVASRYLSLAERSLASSRLDQAKRYLSSAADISPGHPRLAEARDALSRASRAAAAPQ